MAGPKHPRHYDGAFKRQIVQSCESGKPSREIGAEYDIARSTLRRWVQDIRDRRLEMEADVSDKRRRYSHEGRRDTGQRRQVSNISAVQESSAFPAPPTTG